MMSVAPPRRIYGDPMMSVGRMAMMSVGRTSSRHTFHAAGFM